MYCTSWTSPRSGNWSATRQARKADPVSNPTRAASPAGMRLGFAKLGRPPAYNRWHTVEPEVRERRVGRWRLRKSELLMQLQRPHRNASATSVAQGAHKGHVGASGTVGALPQAGAMVAAGCAHRALEEAVHDPGVPAHGMPAVAVAPPGVVLKVEDGADRDDADTQGIMPAAGALGVILTN